MRFTVTKGLAGKEMGAKEMEGEREKRRRERIKMCCVHGATPRGERNDYVLQTCTDKN